ncbi:LuxR family transcriptional regulator [Terasakiella sp. SH-1]|uniref:helix-turn-helix transcriptional regulator n=1 Tax=Terasakiella sp. SH-1 TaxID=2560057 RepID=UPI001073A40E|nr:LuxR family transcriptional regulator [Terasakiella sp. SH-1]
MNRLQSFIGELSEAKTPDILADLFSVQINSLGFSTFAYFNFGVPEGDWVAHRHNYGSIWEERYLNESYGEIDPVFEHGTTAKLPFAWSCNDSTGMTARQQQMMGEAKECGLGNGLTIPNRSVGFKSSFISVASDEADRAFKQALTHNAADLHLLALHFDAYFADLTLPENSSGPLTARELECLKWAKDGKSNSEISDIMRISTKTVESHFTNVFNKFGVYSRTQAVVRGLTMGLISP